MARFRPLTKLLGLSPSERTVRAMALSWGVTPMAVATYRSTDELVWCAVEAAVAAGHLQSDDVVAVLAGAPDQDDGAHRRPPHRAGAVSVRTARAAGSGRR